MHPRSLRVESRLDRGLEVGAKRNAKAASDRGVGDQAIASGGMVAVDGRVKGERKDTPMGEVEEKEDGLGDRLAGEACLFAKAKSGLDGDDAFCIWCNDEGPAVICVGGGGRGHDGEWWKGMAVRRDGRRWRRSWERCRRMMGGRTRGSSTGGRRGGAGRRMEVRRPFSWMELNLETRGWKAMSHRGQLRALP